ncbi:NTP transferase domain-containing protein [Dokdonella immobilis]|nr:NTP transferase domain-containing protein [Dokdonella immobilis]
MLAAGSGSRMGMRSTSTPKCLTLLAGHALITWQRRAFVESGMSDRLLVVLEDSPLTAAADEEIQRVSGTRGPMDSLFSIDAERISHGAVVCYADIVFHASVLQTLLASAGDICIVADRAWLKLWECRFDSILDDAETFRARGTSILEIGDRAQEVNEIEAQFIGMMKLSPQGFATLRALHEPGDDSTRLLSRAVRAGVPVQACFIEGRWCEVDSPSDVAAYEQALGGPEIWSHDWRTC